MKYLPLAAIALSFLLVGAGCQSSPETLLENQVQAEFDNAEDNIDAGIETARAALATNADDLTETEMEDFLFELDLFEDFWNDQKTTGTNDNDFSAFDFSSIILDINERILGTALFAE